MSRSRSTLALAVLLAGTSLRASAQTPTPTPAPLARVGSRGRHRAEADALRSRLLQRLPQQRRHQQPGRPAVGGRRNGRHGRDRPPVALRRAGKPARGIRSEDVGRDRSRLLRGISRDRYRRELRPGPPAAREHAARLEEHGARDRSGLDGVRARESVVARVRRHSALRGRREPVGASAPGSPGTPIRRGAGPGCGSSRRRAAISTPPSWRSPTRARSPSCPTFRAASPGPRRTLSAPASRARWGFRATTASPR